MEALVQESELDLPASRRSTVFEVLMDDNSIHN